MYHFVLKNNFTYGMQDYLNEVLKRGKLEEMVTSTGPKIYLTFYMHINMNLKINIVNI